MANINQTPRVWFSSSMVAPHFKTKHVVSERALICSGQINMWKIETWGHEYTTNLATNQATQNTTWRSGKFEIYRISWRNRTMFIGLSNPAPNNPKWPYSIRNLPYSQETTDIKSVISFMFWLFSSTPWSHSCRKQHAKMLWLARKIKRLIVSNSYIPFH